MRETKENYQNMHENWKNDKYVYLHMLHVFSLHETSISNHNTLQK